MRKSAVFLGEAFARLSGERVTFLCLCKKPKETRLGGAVSGFLPSDCACALPCGLFFCALAAPQGPRLCGILPQKCQRANPIPRRSAGMHGFVDQRRRPRCRASQAWRDQPTGSRRWIAAIVKQYRDVLSEQPRCAEKRRAVRFARCESNHRVRCLAFWLLLGNAKSNSLARRASESIALLDQDGFRLSPE